MPRYTRYIYMYRKGKGLTLPIFNIKLVQVIRFELMISIWKTEVIPLNYTCYFFRSHGRILDNYCSSINAGAPPNNIIYHLFYRTITLLLFLPIPYLRGSNDASPLEEAISIMSDSNQHHFTSKVNAIPIKLMMHSTLKPALKRFRRYHTFFLSFI